MKKGCLVGASGKLRRYMVQHALDRGHGGVGVCREQGMGKLNAFNGGITVVPGATNDRRCRVSPPGRNPYHGDVENGSGMSPRREMSRAGGARRDRIRRGLAPARQDRGFQRRRLGWHARGRRKGQRPE